MRFSNPVRYLILGTITIILFVLVVFAAFKFTPLGDKPDTTAQQQQAQIEKNKKAPSKPKSTPAPAPTPAKTTPVTTPGPVAQPNPALANSGPGDVVALFAVVVVLAGLMHHRFAFRLSK